MSNTEQMVSVPRGWLYRINPSPRNYDWQFTGSDEHAARLSKSSNVEIVKLPAAQPHGEPVTLPERKAITAHGLTALDSEAEGWNAFLDEIAKLGPLYARPIPTQGTAKPVGEVVGRRMEEFRFMPRVKWADDAQNGRTQPGTKLYTHADPGEVERLRAELAETQRISQEEELRANRYSQQLAERDALLKRQPSFINALEKFEADDGTFVRLGDVLGAISASAEPSAPVERDDCEHCGDTGLDPCTVCAALERKPK